MTYTDNLPLALRKRRLLADIFHNTLIPENITTGLNLELHHIVNTLIPENITTGLSYTI
jgi:hypothetical protein